MFCTVYVTLTAYLLMFSFLPMQEESIKYLETDSSSLKNLLVTHIILIPVISIPAGYLSDITSYKVVLHFSAWLVTFSSFSRMFGLWRRNFYFIFQSQLLAMFTGGTQIIGTTIANVWFRHPHKRVFVSSLIYIVEIIAILVPVFGYLTDLKVSVILWSCSIPGVFAGFLCFLFETMHYETDEYEYLPYENIHPEPISEQLCRPAMWLLIIQQIMMKGVGTSTFLKMPAILSVFGYSKNQAMTIAAVFLSAGLTSTIVIAVTCRFLTTFTKPKHSTLINIVIIGSKLLSIISSSLLIVISKSIKPDNYETLVILFFFYGMVTIPVVCGLFEVACETVDTVKVGFITAFMNSLAKTAASVINIFLFSSKIRIVESDGVVKLDGFSESAENFDPTTSLMVFGFLSLVTSCVFGIFYKCPFFRVRREAGYQEFIEQRFSVASDGHSGPKKEW